MSIKDRLAAKTALIAPVVDLPNPPLPRQPKTAPGAMLHAMPLLKEKQAEIDAMSAEMAALRDQVANGGNAAMEVKLQELVEVAGRRRHMPPEKFAELRENLRHNQLVHPVVVRRGAEGRYEIVSGHHRIDAYRELGRSSIQAVILEGTDPEVTDSAFFANLMQSDLTDYEKYVGLKGILARQPNLTRGQLSERTGVSETVISFLLAFENLPTEVLASVAERPTLLGSAAAFQLAGLTKKGRGEQVTAAFKRLAAGEIDQGQTVKLAAAEPTKAASPAAVPVTVKVKQGKSVYCELRRAKNVMRLQFASEAEAERLQAAIQKVLQEGSENKTL